MPMSGPTLRLLRSRASEGRLTTSAWARGGPVLGHPSALKLVLVDPCAVHCSHAAMDLSSPHTDPLGPECPTSLQASALGPECLMGAEPNPLRSECPARAKANLTIADRGTGAEAHPTVADRGTRAKANLTVAKSRPRAKADTPIPVRSSAIGQLPHVPARNGVRHPRDRPP